MPLWNYRVMDDGRGGEWMRAETADSEQEVRRAAQELLRCGCLAVSCCPSDMRARGFLLVAYRDMDGDWLEREEVL